MKTMKKVLVFLLASLLLLSLVSCGDKSGSIKKAFEKADYEVASLSSDDEDAKGVIALLGLNEEQKEDIAKYEIILCNEGNSGDQKC